MGSLHSITKNTTNGIITATFYANGGAVPSTNPVKVTATADNYTTNATESAYIKINPVAYVNIYEYFKTAPWGSTITNAHYKDTVWTIISVSNAGPDSTSIRILDQLTGLKWTGKYYTLSGTIPPFIQSYLGVK